MFLTHTIRELIKKFFISLIFIITPLLFIGCSENTDDSPDAPTDPNNTIQIDKRTGFVQKGPFHKNSSISLSPLDPQETDQVYKTQTLDNYGLYEFEDIILSSKLVEIKAQGSYYNEVTGSDSENKISLIAISDISSSTTINLNVLTHLESKRVLYLLQEGKTFGEAKQTAQKEVLALFDLQEELNKTSQSQSDYRNSEEWDISQDELLFIISVILQGDLSASELHDLLERIAEDIEEDGIVNDQEILSLLRTAAMNLDLSAVWENLKEIYPDIHQYIDLENIQRLLDVFLEYTAKAPEIISAETIMSETSFAKIKIVFNPNSSETIIDLKYGESEELGASMSPENNPFQGSDNIDLELTLNELSAGTTYFYQLTAENEHGIVSSEIKSFVTGGALAEETRDLSLSPEINSVSFEGYVNPNSLDTRVFIEFSKTADNFSSENSILITQDPVNSETETKVSGSIDNLDTNTSYYFRLRMENAAGISYGKVQTTNTLEDKSPMITYFGFSNITASSVDISYTINNHNISSKIDMTYSLSENFANPVIHESQSISGYSEEKTFTTSVNGLAPGTIYYFKLEINNDHGNDLAEGKVTTNSGSIMFMGMTSSESYHGEEVIINVTTFYDNSDNLEVSRQGFLFGSAPGLTLQSNDEVLYSSSITDTYTGTFMGFKNSTHYVRAFVETASGNFFSDEIEIITIDVPTVVTSGFHDIFSTSAVIHGDITDDGGGEIISSGYCWSKAPNPTIRDNMLEEEVSSTTKSIIDGLDPNTTYYIRAYAKNRAGISYGNVLEFTTTE
ncbi:fibronectin type III domain-containing protein [Gramella sp. KN1008]|uniref:fibronectin type III domain-containing protein n=1 Tax=Gramella sp. KN1008 TaxID=2529298 RepID=UPI00103D04E5|nr:fibronectin type III domain-containing protein [Gramella sp. KN1008]TBW25894.1 fibronectin type III domain-containing protein [Gramella sp. KN1008]